MLKSKYKNLPALLSCFLACLFLNQLLAQPAQARLGESFQSYKKKLEGGWKLKGQDKKDVRTYFMYTMLPDQNTLAAAPGFGGGLTVTVVQGRITGESMVLRLGDSPDVGKVLAATHALDFAYEATAKPPPKTKPAIEKELAQYSQAIDMALGGKAQNVGYKGINARIVLSKTTAGDVLIAITRATEPASAQARKPASGRAR